MNYKTWQLQKCIAYMSAEYMFVKLCDFMCGLYRNILLLYNLNNNLDFNSLIFSLSIL